jgi:hypothetical protein
MIGASSASIFDHTAGIWLSTLRIAQARSLFADFGINLAFARIKIYQSRVQSWSYSSTRSATRALTGCFANARVVLVEHASAFGLSLYRRACRQTQNRRARYVAGCLEPMLQASQLWLPLAFSAFCWKSFAIYETSVSRSRSGCEPRVLIQHAYDFVAS